MTVDRAAAVAGRGAPGVPALHDAGVAVALADAGDIDALALFEDVSLQDVAHVQGGAVLKAELVQVLHHAHAGLLKVALLRLGELLGGDFAVAELDGVVAFLVRRLLLDDDAGPASITVTGTTLPASSKICVMPTFLPMMAFFMSISS